MFMQHFSTKRFALGLCFLFFLLPQVCTVKALSAESASQTDVIFAEMNALTDDGELSFDKAVESGQRAAMALSPETLWHFGFDAFAKALRESFTVFPLLVADDLTFERDRDDSKISEAVRGLRNLRVCSAFVRLWSTPPCRCLRP